MWLLAPSPPVEERGRLIRTLPVIPHRSPRELHHPPHPTLPWQAPQQCCQEVASGECAFIRLMWAMVITPIVVLHRS